MKNILALLLFFVTTGAKSQIITPVKWSYAAKKIKNGEAIIFLRATIDAPWHIYSVYQAEGGPVKTTFTFVPSEHYILLGTLIEPKSITKHEEVFHMDVHYFENSVIFKQKIKLKTKQLAINGKVSFMTCNSGKCLPPEDVDFNILIK